MKINNLDKPVYETPNVSKLDALDEAHGGEVGYCSPGSGAQNCEPTGASLIID